MVFKKGQSFSCKYRDKRCLVCGGVFEPKCSVAKFCSDECRIAVFISKYRESRFYRGEWRRSKNDDLANSQRAKKQSDAYKVNAQFVSKYESEILNKIQSMLKMPIERQFYVNGFFLDGFCKKLNLAIEVDGANHKYSKKRDTDRQKKISDILGCRFLRINEEDYVKCKNLNIRRILNDI
jgi:very-short-patch-repair endonuclease